MSTAKSSVMLTLIPSLISSLMAGRPPGFGQRLLRVRGKQRRHLQADVAVAPARSFINRAEGVGSVLNVAYSQLFIDAVGIEVPIACQLLERVRIVVAAGNRLLEDRRVGSHAPQPVLLDHSLELAARKQVPANVIQPDRLAILLQLL